MIEPNLDKLRRFCLAIALILLTYSIAGISFDPKSVISPLGLALKISRPELLPIGLVIASFYGMVSFYYYGFMLHKSPFRIRRDIISGLNAREPDFVPGKDVNVYFGPTEFKSSTWTDDRKKVESYVNNFPGAFPKFARAKATAEMISEESFSEDGEPYMSHAAEIKIPVRCRLAAIFQDVDYASPVWLNVVALIVTAYCVIFIG